MGIDYSKLYNPFDDEIKSDISGIKEELDYQMILAEISYVVLKYRKEHDLTQKELAEKLGMKQSMISKLESGEYNPTLKQLHKISMKLTNSSDLFLEMMRQILKQFDKISHIREEKKSQKDIDFG
ncbi:MAG: helix-turn-helix transcriptional regulator [Clostridia bacterium]|nr:helix-turn-helix transcriptional regulator [Clostridia bacterium]